MKKLTVIFIAIVLALGVSILTYAQNPEGGNPQERTSIEQRKAKIISSIDERIKMLQEDKSCVSTA
jgi:hypothetical protein